MIISREELREAYKEYFESLLTQISEVEEKSEALDHIYTVAMIIANHIFPESIPPEQITQMLSLLSEKSSLLFVHDLYEFILSSIFEEGNIENQKAIVIIYAKVAEIDPNTPTSWDKSNFIKSFL